MLKPRVDLRRDGVVMQRLADTTIVPGHATEVAVLVNYQVTIAPFVILDVPLIVAVQIPEMIDERIHVGEIVRVKEGARWQQSPTVVPRRSHYYRDREFAVRVPEHLLRQVFPAIGVLERQVELVRVQGGAVPVEVTRTDGPVAVQASSENVQVIAEQRLERLHVGPSSVTASAVAAQHGDQFSLDLRDDIPVTDAPVGNILRDSHRSSIGNRYIAIHSIGHGPVEQAVVIR